MAKKKKVTAADFKKYSKDWWWFQVKSYGSAIILVLIIRSSLLESFVIPSGSMIPSLQIGDRIFLNKFSYGLIVPFTDWLFDEPVYFTKRQTPKNGDVIVFKFPEDPSIFFIKRVIGVPGDRVRIEGKQVIVNDKPLALEPLNDPAVMSDLDERHYRKENMKLFNEAIPGSDRKHFVLHDTMSEVPDDFPEFTVPPEKLFVMGDNRDFSNDSRFWGYVPMSYLRGKALVIWLSLWVDFSKSEYYFRPTRTGKLIH